MNKYQLDTPCLVIDKAKLDTNLSQMSQDVSAGNKQLRPHIKTHKSTQLAHLQIQSGAIGVSATKVGEAEALVKAKVPGILITSPVVTEQKINRLMQCVEQDNTLMVVTDSVANAKQLNQAASERNLILNVLVDIDPGVGRTGMKYDEAEAFVKMIINKCPKLIFKGIQCYAGNLQHIENYQQRKQASLKVVKRAGELVTHLRQQNIACDILSGSGTGTYEIDMQVAEVTEVQPGSYTVMDMEYTLIGSAQDQRQFTRFQPAMTMLVTVISANHDSHVTVDAGTKALYFEPNTRPKIISHPGLHYDWSVYGDEHGKITADEGASLPKVGEVLELIVPHCDPTINLFNRLYVVENNEIVDEWLIDMRGRCQ